MTKQEFKCENCDIGMCAVELHSTGRNFKTEVSKCTCCGELKDYLYQKFVKPYKVSKLKTKK